MLTKTMSLQGAEKSLKNHIGDTSGYYGMYYKELFFMGKTIEEMPLCVKEKGTKHMLYFAGLEFGSPSLSSMNRIIRIKSDAPKSLRILSCQLITYSL